MSAYFIWWDLLWRLIGPCALETTLHDTWHLVYNFSCINAWRAKQHHHAGPTSIGLWLCHSSGKENVSEPTLSKLIQFHRFHNLHLLLPTSILPLKTLLASVTRLLFVLSSQAHHLPRDYRAHRRNIWWDHLRNTSLLTQVEELVVCHC